MTEIAHSDTNRSSVNELNHWKKLKAEITEFPFLAIYNIAITIGGLITYIFFIDIGYFPELDLKDTAVLFIGVALIGIILTILFLSMFVFPSLMIRNIYTEHFNDSQNNNKFIALSTLSSFSAFSLLTCSIFAISYFQKSNSDYRLIAIVSGTIMAAIQIGAWKWHNNVLNKQGIIATEQVFSNKPEKLMRNLTLTWFAAWLPLSMMFVIPILDGIEKENYTHAITFFSTLILLIVANSFIASIRKNTGYLLTATFSAILLGTLFIVPQENANLTRAPFKTITLGEMDNVSIIVTREACDTLNIIIKTTACEFLPDKNVGRLQNAKVLSRIGRDFLLEFNCHDVAGAESIKVPLSKGQILIWSLNPKQKKQKSSK